MTNYIIGSFNIERLNDDKDHKKIAEWRFNKQIEKTRKLRTDLLEDYDGK